MAGQRCFQRWDVSDRDEIIPAVQKRKIEMHPVGQNNPCGTKEQDRDASDRGKVIPVVKKCRIEMKLAGGNNPCGEKSKIEMHPVG